MIAVPTSARPDTLSLKGVSNPSAIFLSQHSEPVPGSCVMVTLEGTRPLYEKLGFIEESVVERWRGALPAMPVREFPPDPALDRLAFGADRRAVVALLGAARAGRVANYVGPVVARSIEEARERVLHAGVSGTTYWDVPEMNVVAWELARELGFTPVRKLWRMRKGAPIEERPEFIYALAGFEFG